MFCKKIKWWWERGSLVIYTNVLQQAKNALNSLLTLWHKFCFVVHCTCILHHNSWIPDMCSLKNQLQMQKNRMWETWSLVIYTYVLQAHIFQMHFTVFSHCDLLIVFDQYIAMILQLGRCAHIKGSPDFQIRMNFQKIFKGGVVI